ncbi:MAG: WYL domain-containing protein [Desulfobacterales bacterium]|nr:WYL domain-containing protein [Desulfobacterales bacterium]
MREREWHPAQQLNDHPDGGLELIFPADHLLEVKQWFLSWGGDAEVLAPKALVTEMKQEVARLRAIYE